jgi:nucleotidyltransferase/DNA polymerase involved in DNA repair
LEPALKRALKAVGANWEARAGAAERRFAALAAAGVARAGQALIVSDDRTRRFIAPLPLSLLPLERDRYEELEELGVRTIGQLAGLPGSAVAERLGPDGRRAWSLARGERDGRVVPRRAAEPIVETLEFPEAVGQELTLRRGLGVLVDRLLERPERAGRPPRKLALWARLVGGASWRRTVTLREPTADPARLRIAIGPKLAELPAPALKLRLEVMELAESTGEQLELVRAEGEVLKGRLREGLRQVRAAVGAGGVSMVVEVAPWSRIPEARALLVPRDD